VLNLSKLCLGICRLQEPRLLVSLNVHVVTVIIADVAVVVAFAVEERVAPAEDALVVGVGACVLYEIVEASKGNFVVGAVTVIRAGLVFHAVGKGREDLEAGWASVMHAYKVFVALC
jgi:hypothetical protein